VLSAREAGRLLDAIPAGGEGESALLNLRDRALFELAYSSGLRAEELVSIELADVDYDSEQLRVEGKGRKTRFVPVGEPAIAAVRAYLERARRSSPDRPDRGGPHRTCS
jgi:site-specific recombinase XerD